MLLPIAYALTDRRCLVRSLDLTDTRFLCSGAPQALACVLAARRPLLDLLLGSCGLDDADVAALVTASATAGCRLQRLDVHRSAIGQRAILAIASAAAEPGWAMREIDLTGCSCAGPGGGAQAQALLGKAAVRGLSLPGLDQLEEPQHRFHTASLGF